MPTVSGYLFDTRGSSTNGAIPPAVRLVLVSRSPKRTSLIATAVRVSPRPRRATGAVLRQHDIPQLPHVGSIVALRPSPMHAPLLLARRLLAR